ncbi:N-terminal double-transmembrane domain-containing protein [Terrimicrobium sacchariphilum]|uniref:N-terminal double-transmembrane domain-containing protein n=1 Tax=Terrimicrobium sacchariphilum TaxID=690879 RepID=A0A146G6U0_TERSA|nr:BatA and WFA domain-containing protein [Terrimicrobium sacchariphilum]GAT33449.1 N-terminal double-transmembrane domain-containing protein [Terrimicrobium sacchariphilum]
MSLLFPAALWLSLLGLPIIGFYLLKTRQRRRQVSTLLFWQQIKPKIENSPLWRKLRRWLSLLLQLLILLLVVLAICRPAFDWEKRAAQRTVAVFDPSASMQAVDGKATRWQTARARLDEAISRLRVQDEMAILSAETPPRILSGWTASKRTLREAMAGVEELRTGTDPRAALDLARELTVVRENARIEVYSDSVWPEVARDAVKPDLVLRGDRNDKAENAGITLLAVRRSPVSPGDWQLDAEVVSPAAFTGTLEMRRDGMPMDRVEVKCEPGLPWKKSWRGSTESGSTFAATLQVAEGDALPIDNQASCELAPLRSLRVLLAGPPDPYMEALLESIPLVQTSRVLMFPLKAPDGTDLIIGSGSHGPEERFPSTPVLLVNPTTSGLWGKLEGSLKDTPVTDLDKKSALASHANLGSVVIEEAGQWKPSPGAKVLAASLGNPLIFGQWDERAKWMVIGFDPAKSDLPLRTAFPIFVSNLLQSLRDESGGGKAMAVLPGRVESELRPVAPAENFQSAQGSALPVFPGWWLVLLAGVVVLVLEWFFYSRRLTD